MAFVGGLMPIERPQHLKQKSRSAYNSPIGSPVISPYGSPAGSRRSSISSISSAKTEPGLDLLERLRQESVASTNTKSSLRTNASRDTTGSTKSSLKSLFGRSKKPKEKKDYDKIVLTSRHAAAVKTKLMMDQLSKSKVKTAGITGSTTSAHLSAAAQEARHPHSGPPTVCPKTNKVVELPMLTRIVSGDEQDEEDRTSQNRKAHAGWREARKPTVCDVVEHESDESLPASAYTSTDEDEDPASILGSARKLPAKVEIPSRPATVTRNSYGGRFHKDEKGAWKR